MPLNRMTYVFLFFSDMIKCAHNYHLRGYCEGHNKTYKCSLQGRIFESLSNTAVEIQNNTNTNSMALWFFPAKCHLRKMKHFQVWSMTSWVSAVPSAVQVEASCVLCYQLIRTVCLKSLSCFFPMSEIDIYFSQLGMHSEVIV